MSALRDELTTDPLGLGYAGMTNGEVEASLNAKTRMRTIEKRIGYGAVMATLGVEAGAAVLDALELTATKSSPVKWAMKLLAADNLDVGNPQTRLQIDALAAAGVLTVAQATTLKGLAEEPCSRAQELQILYSTENDVWEARK